MSAINDRSLSLEELVRRSSDIYLAKRMHPDQSIEEMALHKNGKKYPPFKRIVYHFEVLEKLFSMHNDSTKITKIDVFGADSKSQLKMHREYYLENKSKRYAYKSYKYDTDFSKLDTLIVFLLRSDDNGFELVVNNAYESPSQRDEVMNVIKKIGKMH